MRSPNPLIGVLQDFYAWPEGGFTKYDEHAVQQINRNIELYTYKRYGDELLLLDLVNATTALTETDHNISSSTKSSTSYKTVSDYLEQASEEMTDRFEALRAFMLALGDDVQMNTLKNYFAFKRADEVYFRLCKGESGYDPIGTFFH